MDEGGERMNLRDIENLPDVSPLEKFKLKMDCERLKVERWKTWITVISIVIPLAGTIIYGIWSENQRAISSFEIKAVEIVMNASSPLVATNKAVVLSELFPDRLPKNFKEKMLAMYGEPQQKSKQK
jgi:hypothetical protein